MRNVLDRVHSDKVPPPPPDDEGADPDWNNG